jgi:formate/nitrite transporter FocA (FNT family)
VVLAAKYPCSWIIAFDVSHPTARGKLKSARPSGATWWLWNQIPVTLGNIVGGFVFTELAIYFTYKPRPTPEVSPVPTPTQVPAE